MCEKLRSTSPLSLCLLPCLLLYPLAASAQVADSKGGETTKPKTAQVDSEANNVEPTGSRDVPKPVEPQSEEAKKDEAPKDLRIIQLKNSETQQMLQLLAFWFHHKQQHEQGSAAGNSVSTDNSARPDARLSALMGDVRIATDDKAKTLLFRGPKEKLDQLEGVIAEFDVAPDEFKPQAIGDAYFTRVSNDHMLRSGELLSQLGISAKNIMVGETNFLVIQSTDETVIEQAKKILEVAAAQGKTNNDSVKPQKPSKDAAAEKDVVNAKESKSSASKEKSHPDKQ